MPLVTLLSQSANCINWLIPLAFQTPRRRLSTGFSTDCVEQKNTRGGSNAAMNARGMFTRRKEEIIAVRLALRTSP
jgi:hypothetical protein